MNQIIFRNDVNRILKQIGDPSNIQSLTTSELIELVNACRERIIEVTSKTGGHLASSLGTVELTVALFKVFNINEDRIIWDVGHQTYTHKILTGRNDKLEQIGKKGGVGKFLRREESKYDIFGAGHASTSISAALGVAVSNELMQKNNKVVAVIGDGAMTGGLAFEAMNHAGHLDKDLIVILNDNERSIDANVGGLSKTFTRFQSSKTYNRIRKEISSLDNQGKLSSMIVNTFRKINDSFMVLMTPGIWFEKLHFRYFGPIDGHNLEELVALFQQTKDIQGPILLHIFTKKGKGYLHAEGDSFKYHGVTPFEPGTGQFFKKTNHGKSYTSVWSEFFYQIIKKDKKVTAISAAMIGNTGLTAIQKYFPDRVFDVGIAEGHGVTFSAGLATQGIKPFVVIYSTFLQRALDHIIHDVAIQNLPVRFILDRAGFVGADGATHHGQFDLTYLRMVPSFVIMVPKNGVELQQMILTAYNHNSGPIVVRFPRGNTNFSEDFQSILPIPIGQAELIKEEGTVAIFAIGEMVNAAIELEKVLSDLKISCSIVNARFVKPLDEKLLLQQAKNATCVITMEENMKKGGFGSGVMEMLHENQVLVPVKSFGIQDKFIEYKTQEEQKKESCLDLEGMKKEIISFVTQIRKQP